MAFASADVTVSRDQSSAQLFASSLVTHGTEGAEGRMTKCFLIRTSKTRARPRHQSPGRLDTQLSRSELMSKIVGTRTNFQRSNFKRSCALYSESMRAAATLWLPSAFVSPAILAPVSIANLVSESADPFRVSIAPDMSCSGFPQERIMCLQLTHSHANLPCSD